MIHFEDMTETKEYNHIFKGRAGTFSFKKDGEGPWTMDYVDNKGFPVCSGKCISPEKFKKDFKTIMPIIEQIRKSDYKNNRTYVPVIDGGSDTYYIELKQSCVLPTKDGETTYINTASFHVGRNSENIPDILNRFDKYGIGPGGDYAILVDDEYIINENELTPLAYNSTAFHTRIYNNEQVDRILNNLDIALDRVKIIRGYNLEKFISQRQPSTSFRM